MKKIITLLLVVLLFNITDSLSATTPPLKRMLWASINSLTNTTNTDYSVHNKKVLVTWRMFPTDDKSTGFDLYCKRGKSAEIKLNSEPITHSTNFRDSGASSSVDNVYRLCYSGSNETLDTYTLIAERVSQGLPYIPIPLKETSDIHSTYIYKANDVSIGDLDGDGVSEIIVKRLVVKTVNDDGGVDEDTDIEALIDIQHSTLIEAYKLDGTFLWRMKMGPNVLVGNGCSFAVYDFDGDGKCEIAIRTAEGTVFGDGIEIGDTNKDGKIDYRIEGKNYIHGGPEFLSVIEGTTGKEFARTDYIALGKSEDWGDNYYKRSSSYRISLGRFSDTNTSVLICRGVYRKIVVEAWDFKDNNLSKRWRFDTTDGIHTDYAGQGFHSLSIGDVDSDGYDEVAYGACTIDHDGTGLNNSKFGHGDALHLGKFDPSRDGLQIWSCFEGGSVGTAFKNAQTGEIIWKFDSTNDIGRALIADIDADSPGCEMWWYGSNAYSIDGVDLGYKPGSCNMAIWFSGFLNRQLLDAGAISGAKTDKGRVFTIYKYEVSTINSTKSNPCFYGDILGDWREEVIMVARDNSELRLFSTWYPCDYKFPYLMSDHVYEMSAINQNVGYNMPTQLGYYLGSDLISNPPSNIIQEEANANKVRVINNEIIIESVEASSVSIYSISGRLVATKFVENGYVRFSLSDKGVYLIKIGNKVSKIIL